MVLETHEEDFGPEVLIQGVLGLHHRQIIAGGNDTAVQDNKIIFAWGQDYALLLTSGRNEKHQGGGPNGAEASG
jgi:hypothetical protein